MRMVALYWLVLLVLVGCARTPALSPTPTPTPDPTATPAPAARAIRSVCLVTDIGNISDGTYNTLAYQGMERAAQAFDLESRYFESAAEGDFATHVAACLDEGYDAVVTLGPSNSEVALAAAKSHPEVQFIGVDHFLSEPPPPNMAIIQYREDQAGFLAGALACMMTESNTVGGIYGIDFAALKRFRHGFEHGCHYVNPDATILGAYLDSFTDPRAGAAQATAWLAEGADVIFGAAGATGSGAIRAAAEEGAWVIGVDQDEYRTTFAEGALPGADHLLSSAVKRVDAGVYQQVQALAQPGTIPWGGGGFYTLDASNEGIGYAPFHEAERVIPAAVQARLAEIQAALAEGSLTTGVDFDSGEPRPDQRPAPDPFEG